MKDRVILHCDCNSFFASVETALNPELKKYPIAVCGSTEDRHGIVLAKNEKAKRFGIQTAETVYSAKKKCPDLVICKPHYDKYSEFSKRVNEIYHRYTDMVEPFGIDESWLDVTASIRFFGSGIEIAEKISNTVKNEIGITLSIGVSFNKVFAKLGSDYKKPDAITVIDRDNLDKIVYPQDVSNLLFVGRKTTETLKLMGIKTIGDLAKADKSILISRFGKSGEMLYKYARGEDDSPVSSEENDETKSISHGFTFRHDLVKPEEVKTAIRFLCENIGTKLRQKNLKACTVQLSIKDEYLRTIQRQKPHPTPTDIGTELAALAYEIFSEEWKNNRPIRTLTVSATGLISSEGFAKQLSFLDEEIEAKRDKIKNSEETIDKIRQKHGSDSIFSGSLLDSDLGIFKNKD